MNYECTKCGAIMDSCGDPPGEMDARLQRQLDAGCPECGAPFTASVVFNWGMTIGMRCRNGHAVRWTPPELADKVERWRQASKADVEPPLVEPGRLDPRHLPADHPDRYAAAPPEKN